jgi:hypothetical protein
MCATSYSSAFPSHSTAYHLPVCLQVGWPGSIGALSGFSDQQLAISEIGVRTLLYREHLQCVFLLATMPPGVQNIVVVWVCLLLH